MSVDDAPGAPSTNFTAADIPYDDSGASLEGANVQAFLDVLDGAIDDLAELVSPAANVTLIDTPSGDAETTCNAIIDALVAAGLMEGPP